MQSSSEFISFKLSYFNIYLHQYFYLKIAGRGGGGADMRLNKLYYKNGIVKFKHNLY
jgi:hypothetical protein